MKRSTPRTAAERAIHRILRLCSAQKFDARSAATVSAAARKHRLDPDVLLVVAEYRELAAVHHRKYRCAPLERAYRRVLELDPCNARAWQGLASVLDIDDRFADAARAAQRARRLDNDPQAVALLARIRAQQGRKAEARRLARTIRRARSGFARDTAKAVLDGKWDPF
jgi:Flp pilus assembly protein TadD